MFLLLWNAVHCMAAPSAGLERWIKINTYLRNNNLVCLSALDKHMVYAPSSESYEFFSELSSLLPALECPKSEPEFIRGFCDCWWQQVRFCRQFQNSQRSPESWSALCCRPFTSFVFGQTVVWHVIQPVSFPLGRDFLSLILKTGSRCLSELDTDPSPYFFLCQRSLHNRQNIAAALLRELLLHHSE